MAHSVVTALQFICAAALISWWPCSALNYELKEEEEEGCGVVIVFKEVTLVDEVVGFLLGVWVMVALVLWLHGYQSFITNSLYIRLSLQLV